MSTPRRRRLHPRRCAAVALGLAGWSLLSLGATPAAFAHGDFDTGSPGPGDSVAAGVDLLSLQFASIDPGSTATVTLAETGQRPLPVGAALPLVDQGRVCARSAPLAPGIYTLTYSLVSPDGAVSDGGYVFEVVPATEAESVLDPAGCAGVALRPPVARSVPTAGSESAAPMIAAAGAVGVVVAGASLVALRRRQAT